ncbi:methylamine utilization protein [Pseudoalteromonas rubra]|uniref:Methylamine utilization protein n=1 Tax=Pseudoalteromonas rubra TaxID=43658 RepID=A0A5S3V2P2_9GAMM|nr:methylamine utilization protein [Pseudoalteromonas rubra]QPB81900.1 methylamine utilization protein [Pseudoalteromonas rubra]
MNVSGHNPVRIAQGHLILIRRALGCARKIVGVRIFAWSVCAWILAGLGGPVYGADNALDNSAGKGGGNGSGNGYTLQLRDQHSAPLSGVVVEVVAPLRAGQVQQVAVMDQVNKQFHPRLLTIMQGQAVSFPNSDDIRHHVYSFSETKRFELKLYAGTPIQPIRFEQPGVVVLGCNIHDSMVGYIYVSQSKDVLTSDQSGTVQLPAYAQQVAIWHAQQTQDIDTRRIVTVTELQQSGSAIVETQAPAPRNTFSEMFKDHHGH